jgi:hypothetical protein
METKHAKVILIEYLPEQSPADYSDHPQSHDRRP